MEILETRKLLAGDVFDVQTGSIPRAPEEITSLGEEFYRQFDNAPKSEANSVGITDLDSTFLLHSRPEAAKTIYLDFDGFRTSGTFWNQSTGTDPIISPAWDPAGNGPSFTNGELLQIQQIWQLVSADFSPFDINVTTEDPGEADLVNTGGNDNRWGIRVVFTPDDLPAPGSGGVAYIGSFSWGYNTPGASDTPTYVFNYGVIGGSAAASHEVGHTLGLSHDGTNAQHPFQPNAVYYDGHGTGEFSWGPIMGSGYYTNVTTWDNGVYFGTNNGGADANYGSGPDDLQVIVSQNGFGYVTDDFGGSTGSASELSGTVNAAGRVSISQFGTIERNDDLDYFSFQTGDGPINLTINPYVTEMYTRNGNDFTRSIENSFRSSNFWGDNQGTNLNVEGRIYNEQGVLVAVSTPAGLAAQFSNLDLVAGTYFLSIDGIGFGTPTANPPTGYTDFGSIGEYLITGDISVALGLQFAKNPVLYTEDSPPVQIAPGATLIDATAGGYQGTTITATVVTTPGASDQIQFVPPAGSSIRRDQFSLFYQDVFVGSIRNIAPSNLEIVFNSAATPAAIEAAAVALVFVAAGDAPDPSPRDIVLSLQKGVFNSSATLPVIVTPVNDAPQAYPTAVDPINEDNVESPGTLVRDLLARGVIDPDGEPGVGIVISNGAISALGVWQYRAGATWRNVGNTSITSGLVLGVNTRVRFVPARDFFGDAPPMTYYPIDSTYTGGFTANNTRATVNIAGLIASSTTSAAPSFVNQQVLPVNDAPVGNYSILEESILQDDTRTITLPSDLFVDVDDNQISLSLRNPGGTSSPSWITFDPVTRTVNLSPRNNHVGQTLVDIVGTDPQGLFGIVPLVITVINVNDPPERISLSARSVPENSAGQVVGGFTTIDPDAGDSHSYTVDDPRFIVVNNILRIAPNAIIDFESERSIVLNVTTTDSGTPPLSFTQSISLAVQNVNEFPPRFPTRPIFETPEIIAPGTLVGTLSAVDDDADTVLTFQVVEASPFFDVNPTDGSVRLKQGMTLNYAQQSVHEFVVVASDGLFGSAAQTVTVIVLQPNRFSPVFTTTSLEVSEGARPGVPFARIQATDADPQSSVRFELISSDLPLFDLNQSTGDLTLRDGSSFDAVLQSQYSLTVRAHDSGTPSRSTEATIPITIIPIRRPPTGISVTPPSILESVSGLGVGQVQVLHTNTDVTYQIESIDSRFEVSGNELRLRDGRYVEASNSQAVVVPMRVREVLNDGSLGRLFPIDVTLAKIANRSPWQNRLNRLDVNRDTSVDPLDVLLLVNAVNDDMLLTVPRPASTLSQPDLDVDGDNSLSPIDVLLVINQINEQTPGGGAEGESSVVDTDTDYQFHEAAFYAVLQELEEERAGRRRRGS